MRSEFLPVLFLHEIRGPTTILLPEMHTKAGAERTRI